jgi:hypothetical protein
LNRAFLASAIFCTIGIISIASLLPVYSDSEDYPFIDSENTVLRDVVKANGKHAFWELYATLNIDLVEWAKNLDGDSHGAGIMILPDYEHTYTVGIHTYNNCQSFDCGDYVVHGHLSEVKDAGEVCASHGYQLESVPGSVVDLGKGHIVYKTGLNSTLISLVNVDAYENEMANSNSVCDNSENSDVGDVYLYDTQVITEDETNYLCVHISEPVTLKNSSINGFSEKKTPDLCSDP